jgi:hypothetical protein
VELFKEGIYHACGTDDSHEIKTSPDWVYFTDRKGNLHSVIGNNPNCSSIAVDPTAP